MVKKKRVDDDLKKDLNATKLQEFLVRAGLPEDYPGLSPKNRQKARLSSLTSWFDPEKPHILCTDTEAFVKAMFLWVEHYMKPARVNHGKYHFDDPLNKYDMVRTTMLPPRDPVSMSPAKSIITATRRTGKTETVCVEQTSLITCVRPFSLCLFSALNDELTKQGLAKIQIQFQENEQIHSDFGELVPRRGQSRKWSSHHLQFAHLPGTEIMAHSLGSAQRGRGPIWGIIDDPEDEENSYNEEWRKWFFAKLFRVYVPMFTFGGKLIWIGTPLHAGSCLSLAMKGQSEIEESEVPEDKGPTMDVKFRDWQRGRYPIILKEGDQYRSMQPQRLSVSAFLRRMEIDPITTRAEILCEPVTPGTRAFRYDPIRHGFLHCRSTDGTEYMLDLKTGKKQEWTSWMKTLRVFGGGDLGSGASAESDPGAVIFIGIDPDRIVYVLFAYIRICNFEILTEVSCLEGARLKAERVGWERAGLLAVINPLIRRHVARLQKSMSDIPGVLELNVTGKKKERRIIGSLSGLFTHEEIRFLQFDVYKDAQGTVHILADCPFQQAYRDLVLQVQEYTDQGLSGHDDGIDALQIAVKTAGSARGDPEETEDLSGTERVERMWEKLGVPLEPEMVPPEARTPKMWDTLEKRVFQDTMVYGEIPNV